MPLPLPAQNVPRDCIEIYTSSASARQLVVLPNDLGEGKVNFSHPRSVQQHFITQPGPLTHHSLYQTHKAMPNTN